jgi:hypothetical protein
MTTRGEYSTPGVPPYHPPPDVVYPEGAFPNPHCNDMAVQPTFANFIPGSLYRPEALPITIDERVNKASVWMAVEKDTSEQHVMNL